MFESLIVTLREGAEAALVVGIILAYLRKTGRGSLSRAVFAGLGAGIVASIFCAVLFSSLGVQEEAYEGWLMLVGSLFVSSMVYWMWRTSKGHKEEIETRVERIASRGSGAIAVGLFLLTFLMVLREGIETILFLGAVNLTTDAVLSFFGGLVGLSLAAVFGVAFVRGTVRVDLGRFFKVTELVLAVLAVQLLIGGLHELGEQGTLPVGKEEMRIIGPIVKNEVLVMISLLALPLIIVLIPGRAEKKRIQGAEALEGPERRLALARIRREIVWRRLLATAGMLVIACLTVSYAFSSLPRGIDPPAMLEPDSGGNVRIARTGLNDGHLHRFGVSLQGTVVRFFVMRSGSRLIPSFDACQVCGAYGYVEIKGRLVCLACAADINTATLGVGGGCNPLPLAYKDEGDDFVISLNDLAKQVKAFRATETTESAPPTY